MLFFVAIANLFTKKIATIYGLSFTVVLFIIFLISERVNRRKMQDDKTGLENFNLDHQPQIVAEHIRARPGSVLIAVRGNNMEHLRRTLEKTNLRRHDIVVMTVQAAIHGRGRIRS